MVVSRLVRRIVWLVFLWLLAGLAGATLVWLAPGFGIDERELDPRWTEASLSELRAEQSSVEGPVRYYIAWLSHLARGDLGESSSIGQPVVTLLKDRLPETARPVALGLLLGWSAGLLLAFSSQFLRLRGYDLAATTGSGIFLCLPEAVLALAFLFLGAPISVPIAAVVFPRVFRYARNLFVGAATLPHVITATAKGLGRGRILLWHILPAIGPELIALLGVSVSLAFTASIPVEVICDSPGVGQLAWMAAMARDLPVLINVTLIIAAVTLVSNSLADWLVSRHATEAMAR